MEGITQEITGRINQFNINAEPSNVGPRWRKWLGRFETYLIAINIDADERKKALLLYLAGEEVEELYNTIKPAEQAEDFAHVKERLTAHFDPQVNEEYERFVFRGTSQDSHETVDQYCTKLRKLAANCRFHDKDAEIKSQIIGHCQSDSLRRRALRTPNLSLSDLLTMARTLEKSELQTSDMEKTHSNNCASVKSLSLRKPHTRQPIPTS